MNLIISSSIKDSGYLNKIFYQKMKIELVIMSS